MADYGRNYKCEGITSRRSIGSWSVKWCHDRLKCQPEEAPCDFCHAWGLRDKEIDGYKAGMRIGSKIEDKRYRHWSKTLQDMRLYWLDSVDRRELCRWRKRGCCWGARYLRIRSSVGRIGKVNAKLRTSFLECFSKTFCICFKNSFWLVTGVTSHNNKLINESLQHSRPTPTRQYKNYDFMDLKSKKKRSDLLKALRETVHSQGFDLYEAWC